jgi:hypothetical protein
VPHSCKHPQQVFLILFHMFLFVLLLAFPRHTFPDLNPRLHPQCLHAPTRSTVDSDDASPSPTRYRDCASNSRLVHSIGHFLSRQWKSVPRLARTLDTSAAHSRRGISGDTQSFLLGLPGKVVLKTPDMFPTSFLCFVSQTRST